MIQIHLSFSQLGGAADGDKSQTHIGGSFLSLLLQSVGVAVTEVQDVEFKWVPKWLVERFSDDFGKSYVFALILHFTELYNKLSRFP